MDEVNFGVAFNDVDYCLRLREAGKRIVFTPHAQLVHAKSVSRGKDDTSDKRRPLRARAQSAARVGETFCSMIHPIIRNSRSTSALPRPRLASPIDGAAAE